jgi:2-polyprenyl-6-methoxyphenol hydroxylase-like FAD-dependent oxidoreductase
MHDSTQDRCTPFMQRQFWQKCIYNQIKEKTRVRANTGAASFTETEDGVEVTTESGEIVRGDLLLGADGIHSTVRKLLADKVESTGASAEQQMREGFESKYHCIFTTSKNASAKGEQFLPDAIVHNVYY